MTGPADGADVRHIAIEAILPNDPETVWKALTAPEPIARRLMPNDFEATLGNCFKPQAKPMGEWDGVVECEVLEILPHRKLAYSWKGGSDANPKYGARLDSIVTWILTPVEGGTRLRLVHSGFRSPSNDFAFEVMSAGWGRVTLPYRVLFIVSSDVCC
ncbi:MAG: SRPBCC family protein [Rhodomicrobium sp.]